MDNAGRLLPIAGTVTDMTELRVRPDVLEGQARAYGEVVRSVERAADELMGCLAQCGDALGSAGQPQVQALRSAALHGLGVLAHDHRQVQQGLAAVAACVRQLDRGLLRARP